MSERDQGVRLHTSHGVRVLPLYRHWWGCKASLPTWRRTTAHNDKHNRCLEADKLDDKRPRRSASESARHVRWLARASVKRKHM